MNITIYVNRKKLDKNTSAAVDEFAKRLTPFCSFRVIPSASVQPESGKNTASFFITKDSQHKHSTISSPLFAETINNLTLKGISCFHFFIGYDTFSEKECQPFCISHMTLSEDITLIALSEQIYRAFTINNNITYHK